jgi:pyruvate/2-oxoglutarate dehydrogenase complex dihydrolipoamide dehydrogenase (E3) component
MEREFDVVVLGAGAVGENVADRARAAGLDVAIVEHELVGGECSYWACVPSKALLRSAAALRAAQRVRGAAEAVTGDLDVSAVLARRDYWVSHWDDRGAVKWVEGIGAELVRGHGRLDGERRVVVTLPDGGESVLVARHAVAVCTGSTPRVPDIPGLAEVRPWTSRDATSAKRAPRRLAVIGGGVVAAEMASAYAGLGTEVTVLVRTTMLGTMEPFAGDAVVAGLRAAGATVRLGVTPERIERDGDGAVVITLEGGEAVVADEVLVATGRMPRTTGIGVETVGLEPGAWIEVDDTLAVTSTSVARADAGVPWLYAVGDVTDRALYTHQGKYQARAAGDVIAARANGTAVSDVAWGAHVATADHAAVPQVTFTDPEVASVGLTADAARAAGHRVRAVDYEIGWVAGASLHADRYRGTARMVVDEDRSVVVGATFVGPDVAELLQAATIAIVGEVPLDRLWHAVPAYPTISEIWLRLLEAYGRESAVPQQDIEPRSVALAA